MPNSYAIDNFIKLLTNYYQLAQLPITLTNGHAVINKRQTKNAPREKINSTDHELTDLLQLDIQWEAFFYHRKQLTVNTFSSMS